MRNKDIEKIFKDTDYVHTSGTPEELRVAEYLRDRCLEMGVTAHIEEFDVPMANISEAKLFVDGKEIPCEGCFCCGSGEVEGELYYMPGTDPVSIAGAKDKIVLMDTNGIGHFTYQDIVKAGAKGLIFRYGNVHYSNSDIDHRDLRAAVVGEAKKLLCATINVRDAVRIVKNNSKTARIVIKQEEYTGHSHNTVAEFPGERDEWIVLTAHYDTVALSHGAYDNMSGCAGILGVLDALRKCKHNYGLRLVFCGSEERGLLGSKAYVAKHEDELEKFVLNINLDMIGTYMGHFIACCSSEDRLAGYIDYMGAETGFPIKPKTGVYSSDSTPFADKGIPAVSFARLADNSTAPIHCRYDLHDTLSMNRMQEDIAFVAEFTRRMADSSVCPVKREIPENIKKELDEYLYRKRKD